MANANQSPSSGRQQGRQQTSEPGKATDGVLRIEMNVPQCQTGGRVLQIDDSGSSTTSRSTGRSESQPMGGGLQQQR
jgi:hypothetical protein